jgi:hypothetical protein
MACMVGNTRYSKQMENLDILDVRQAYRQELIRSFDDGFESFH